MQAINGFKLKLEDAGHLTFKGKKLHVCFVCFTENSDDSASSEMDHA